MAKLKLSGDQPTIRIYEAIVTEMPRKPGAGGVAPQIREKGELLAEYHTPDELRLNTGLTVGELRQTTNFAIKTLLATHLPDHESTTTPSGTPIVKVSTHDQTRTIKRGEFKGMAVVAEIDEPETKI